MQPNRITAIYNTMSRTIRNAPDQHKNNLKEELLKIAEEFNRGAKNLLKAEDLYDFWFFQKVGQLMKVEFYWMDASKQQRTRIELGLAQKYLNLIIKDWWCMSEEARIIDVFALHAPFDNGMWNALWKVGLGRFASLRNGGFYVNLSKMDYLQYQQTLVSKELKARLNIPEELNRIETEQVIWSRCIKG